MKNIENLPEEIFDLFQSKSQEELTSAEKRLISEYMEPDEYDDFRLLITDFKTLDEGIKVEVSNKRFTRTSESAIRKLLTYRIPVYQAASVLLLFGFFTYAYFSTDRLERVAEDQFTAVPSVVRDKEAIHKIKEKVLDERLSDIKKVVKIQLDTIGKSLSEEGYPKDLIFNL